MFHQAGLNNTFELDLVENQEDITFSCINGFLWLILFIRTTMGSKLPFLLYISGLFTVQSAISIASKVLYNWTVYGQG